MAKKRAGQCERNPFTACYWEQQPPFSYPSPFPSWRRPGSLYSIKTKLFQFGVEGRSVFSWNASSFWVFCSSWAKAPSLVVSFPQEELSCHTVNPLLVFTWVSAVTFSHLISFPVSHICIPTPVVPPLSLTPHVTLAQRLGSWTERLLNSLTTQFVNAAPGYFRPLG